VWPHPAIERVQQRVSRPVRHTAAAVGLASFSKFETLTSKCPLVDLPIFSAAERHAEVLQLEKSSVSLRRGRRTMRSWSRVCICSRDAAPSDEGVEP